MPKVKQPRPIVISDSNHESSHFELATMETQLGSQVAYYENGDPAQKPMLAFVSDVTPTGLCLHVFTPRGMSVRDYTRHIDDPWFKEIDQRQKTLREKGAWDTLDEAQRRLDAEAALRRAAVIRRQQADEANKQSQIDEIPLMDDIAMAAEEMARNGIALPDMVTRLHGQATIGQLKSHFELNPVSA